MLCDKQSCIDTLLFFFHLCTSPKIGVDVERNGSTAAQNPISRFVHSKSKSPIVCLSFPICSQSLALSTEISWSFSYHNIYYNLIIFLCSSSNHLYLGKVQFKCWKNIELLLYYYVEENRWRLINFVKLFTLVSIFLINFCCYQFITTTILFSLPISSSL